MKPTKKLYDQDAYQTEMDATVVSCSPATMDDKNVYQVVLDKTIFFPEEGGQTPDQGTLGVRQVLDVQIKDGVIVHTLDGELEEGSVVHGILDWNHRFNNMQQHSGEHIFSGLVHARFGYDNVGFHLSDQVVTMDFNGMITPEEAAEIEYAANQTIISNLEVQVSYPSKEELAVLDYRSKIEIEGQVRIITVPNIDVCACCAPHVRRTGEIGMLKIVSMQNYKGGIRISILCGFRALEDFRKKTQVVTELSKTFSANQDTLVEAVEKVKSMNQSLKNELLDAKSEYMEAKLASIPTEQENAYLFETNLDALVMRNAVNTLVSRHAGVSGIFTGNDDEGYRFIMGSKADDARNVLNLLKEKWEVRGGGSPAMVQGSIMAKKEELLSVLK
ncbi:MAG: alanine--tRNA ligase-related protein [bacterium]|nr:alanine--tRNA ligase-related protein [bacterium]